jgi:two-component system OmpR family sensor kinase
VGRHLNYSGLVIAGLGFFLTRFTVTLALYEDPLQFYLAGVVPLLLGLGLAAFGVALTVADVDRALVRTTASWCLVGFGAMLVLVVLTLVGSSADGLPALGAARSQTYLSNVLIGGCVGGTLTGLYAARIRQQRRQLSQRANRLVVLNQLLRDEVLNSVTAIRGFATVDSDNRSDAADVIERHSDAIEETVEEVRYLARPPDSNARSTGPVDLAACLDESVQRVTDTHPDVDVTVESVPETLQVRANERLVQVVAQLLDNAVVHGDDDSPTVAVSVAGDTVSVSVSDDGPGLPESRRAGLEDGDFEAVDAHGTGLEMGLNVVRLFVESYGGTIDTVVDGSGTTVTVHLRRVTDASGELRPNQRDLGDFDLALPHLLVTFGAAVVAGVFYGIASEALGGSIAGIGVFYGTADPVVGWLTHEFHSVVFGFVFVSLVSLAPDRFHERTGAYVAIGTGWALVLWAGAAGLVAPVWLRLLGIPASLPNLSGPLLVAHLVWGVSLGVLTAWGYRYLVPRASSVRERVAARSD